MKIRIGVTNLQSGIGVTKGYGQYLTRGWRYILPHPGEHVVDAGRLLKKERVDLALCMEVDAASTRARSLSQLDMVQAQTELVNSKFFPCKRVGTSIDEGNAILTNLPIERTRLHKLSARVNPRTLGEATVMAGDTRITVFVAHFALGQKARTSQFNEVIEIIKKTRGPVILGGDFNQRDPAAFELFQKAGLIHMCALPNYPSWKPKHALQALFLSEHFEVLHTSIPGESRFSDHLPLIVEARVR
ncbi:MAG: hypothetical protein JWN64_783 [Parcubacteria group bacterium]|nr:hypothetical protein [Parcubacteria group bacterium]